MIDTTEKLLADRLSVPGGRQVSGASRVSWIARFSQKRIFFSDQWPHCPAPANRRPGCTGDGKGDGRISARSSCRLHRPSERSRNARDAA